MASQKSIVCGPQEKPNEIAAGSDTAQAEGIGAVEVFDYILVRTQDDEARHEVPFTPPLHERTMVDICTRIRNFLMAKESVDIQDSGGGTKG